MATAVDIAPILPAFSVTYLRCVGGTGQNLIPAVLPGERVLAAAIGPDLSGIRRNPPISTPTQQSESPQSPSQELFQHQSGDDPGRTAGMTDSASCGKSRTSPLSSVGGCHANPIWSKRWCPDCTERGNAMTASSSRSRLIRKLRDALGETICAALEDINVVEVMLLTSCSEGATTVNLASRKTLGDIITPTPGALQEKDARSVEKDNGITFMRYRFTHDSTTFAFHWGDTLYSRCRSTCTSWTWLCICNCFLY